MTTRRLVAIVVLALSAWAPVFAADLTDDQVRAAMLNAKNHKPLVLESRLFPAYALEVYSPQAWISALTADAQRQMRPFTMADIPQSARADTWRVKVFAATADTIQHAAWGWGSSVTNVVLRATETATPVQPLTKEPFDDSVQNSFGAKAGYNGLFVTFDGAAVREMWGPHQDHEFLIGVAGDGPNRNRTFTVKSKHFAQLR